MKRLKYPLTPSFVADAIASVANNRYSVPYESGCPGYVAVRHVLYRTDYAVGLFILYRKAA